MINDSDDTELELLVSTVAYDTQFMAKRVSHMLHTLNSLELSAAMEGNIDARMDCMTYKLIFEKFMERLFEASETIAMFNQGHRISQIDIINCLNVNAEIDSKLIKIDPIIDNMRQQARYM